MASDGAIQLFAELLLANVLPLSNHLGKTKVSHVRQVLDMMEQPVTVPYEVVTAVQVGAFNGGTAFGVRRWSQLRLLIYFGLHVNSLNDAERDKLAADPLAFRAALAEAPSPKEPAQRAVLRYLTFPKYFRPIVNPTHRRLIRDTFASYLSRPVSDDVDVDLDEITRAPEAEQGEPIDYYTDTWKSMWKPVTSPQVRAEEDDADEDDDLLVAGAEFQIGDPDQELADSLHVDLEWLARCVDLLRDRPQLIFYGPPGTGKTYIAKALARYLAGEDNVKIVQFHPAYSYEDFFEGFRPVLRGNGQVAFESERGDRGRLDRGRSAGRSRTSPTAPSPPSPRCFAVS
ncbi:AAA family ATPase [Rhodococcus sp. HM1]|uniref:AAA family ATPase n=1 Tax=Rhodococcus sp. HM1 TaxID=2937759 RepID=UPI00200B6738|nr:AAA family ATPase [Rhodococcus sp. HM1]MCK8671572.1 AAA family ATPase [Rhodococcus sp. HM1]